MLRLLGEWDPILYADLHVTDGAQFEHDVSITGGPVLVGDEALRRVGRGLRDELIQRLAAQGSLPLDFYPDFVAQGDPASGFAVSVSQARFADGYWPQRNRLAVLLETHSWKDYPIRVRVTRNAVVDMLELAAENGAAWLAAARGADERAAHIGGSSVALAYVNTDHIRTIDFRGYAYTRQASAISGGLATRYDTTRPQVWHVPLRDEVRPSITVLAPRGGYIVPTAHAGWVGEKLALHGIASRILTSATTALDVDEFRATKATLAPATFEGHAIRSVEGDWTPARRVVSAGSLFVPIAQAKSQLVLTLFEPRGPDSLVSWGFFNTAFEPKEYMEPYVADALGVDMLKTDPRAKEEFERRLREDSEFAKSPGARLEFFYRRHPSWDDRLNLYPVLRVEREP
jgi:hypothetical protein